MELPARKQSRLTDYDYSVPNAYFITHHLIGNSILCNSLRWVQFPLSKYNSNKKYRHTAVLFIGGASATKCEHSDFA